MDEYVITPGLKNLLQLALAEDMPYGDITSENLGIAGLEGRGIIIAKQHMILAGIPVARTLFELIDQSVKIISTKKDGETLECGDKIMEVAGKYVSMLKAERTVLNFLQRLSGIATLTSQVVKKVEHLEVRITDTRKTNPLWRCLDKYAVRIGGGSNHRFSLSDAVMIKDNHIAAVGCITEAVNRIRKKVSHTAKIEVEATTMEQVEQALSAGADIILLDNMDETMMAQAVRKINKKAVVEASGGVTPETIVNIAKTGVDVISLGMLTHSAPSVDISLEILQS